MYSTSEQVAPRLRSDGADRHDVGLHHLLEPLALDPFKDREEAAGGGGAEAQGRRDVRGAGDEGVATREHLAQRNICLLYTSPSPRD